MAAALTPEAARQADSTFVGRCNELRLFRGAFDRMLAGRRQIVTILGEPGIGKTRCAEAFARVAEDQGALVLWGRCYEEPGAPPYWPWVQILREYVAASSPSELRMILGSGVAEIAALVPELAEDIDEAPPPLPGDRDATQARFRTFDAIARVFERAAEQVPLVLIVDNLHCADAPSLSLLEFLGHELPRRRILLIGTYRDAEVLRKSPLLSALGGLGRESDVERIRLSGLPQDAIAELATRTLGRPLRHAEIEAINHQTDGNPLFVIELLKVLIEESADAGSEPIAVRIPDGVREAIGRRLSRLSEQCNELLSIASVLGRKFTANELAGAAEAKLADVLVGLEAAVRAGIVEAFGDVPGGYRFTHALIRETLYEELSSLDQLRWHGRVGDALVAIHGSRLDAVLTRVAHHYFRGAPYGNAHKAARYSAMAAEKAVRIYAYEEALAYCDQVMGALELAHDCDDELLARACFLKGYAYFCLGAVDQSVDMLFRAASRAHAVGNAELLSNVVTQLVMATSQHGQAQHIPLLEKTITLLPEDDNSARARALGALAFALRSAGDAARIAPLIDESLAMARRLGDPAPLCLSLGFAVLALRGEPATLPQRLRLGEECVKVARRAGNREWLAEAYGRRALDLLEAGAVDELEALLDRYERLDVSELKLHDCYLASQRITLSLLRGEWDGLEERIEALLESGMKTRPQDAEGVYGAQMFVLNRDRGRLRAFEAVVRNFVSNEARQAWTPGLMLMCAELGLLDHARRHFERLAEDGFARIPRDDMYVTCLVYCAETCCRLGDVQRAGALYRRLLPYAGQTANHPRTACYGAAALYLAMLAAATDDRQAAQRHFDAALALNRAMNAWPWLARTQYRYGAFLLGSAGGDEQDRGRSLLREAEQLAGRLDMEALIDDISVALRGSQDGSAYPDGLTAREIEVLRLIAMGRSNKDISAVLAISLNTVATHVRSILNKTHCANRTEAAAYAIHQGLHSQGRE
jgi:DNA-binding CsgD family transcriptional regulator